TGLKANKAAILPQMGRYAMLHFATHGVLDDRNGLRSALIFAPPSPKGTQYETLDALEILGLSLSAKLVVLSACESGLGQRSGGEGLLGLVWAFRAAGCPSVVASQWKVEDAATQELMVRFYAKLKRGAHKDEALRDAMLSVCRSPQHAHPYYWAAFQV